VVLFNPKLMPAPTGFADTLDPKHGEKLGIIDIQSSTRCSQPGWHRAAR